MACSRKGNKKVKRFFSIAIALPLEMQMLLCNRVYDIKKSFISDKHIQHAMKKIKIYLFSP
jgi:hypothetical protein